MARRRKSRVYWRMQGGKRRAYGDFRDLGGSREALVPVGAKLATTDPDIAQQLASERVRELELRDRSKTLLKIEEPQTLKKYVKHHVAEKRRAGKVTEAEVTKLERQLDAAVEFLGAKRPLESIGVRDVQKWCAWLADRAAKGENGRYRPRRGDTLSGGTLRHYLNALSNLYRRAQSEACVPPGFNPVAAMMDKPQARREEAKWLEVHEAALLLEAARIHEPDRDDFIQCAYPLLATFLLTGGRKSEVLGLEVQDVSFDRKTVTFRPNEWRRLKTRTSHRTVPLWPQLEEILREYIFGGDGPSAEDGLLFPSDRLEEPGMIDDLRKTLATLAARTGLEAVTSKMLRHTYCSTRLQTLDQGAPVSPWTVSREMGHGGRALVDRVYGHLGEVRHRSEVVEYRAEQHEKKLGERLAAIRAWTGKPKECRGTTSEGRPCEATGNLSMDGYCIWHDPKRREQAKAARRNVGGRRKARSRR